MNHATPKLVRDTLLDAKRGAEEALEESFEGCEGMPETAICDSLAAIDRAIVYFDEVLNVIDAEVVDAETFAARSYAASEQGFIALPRSYARDAAHSAKRARDFIRGHDDLKGDE